jgi:hypothetical protein
MNLLVLNNLPRHTVVPSDGSNVQRFGNVLIFVTERGIIGHLWFV